MPVLKQRWRSGSKSEAIAEDLELICTEASEHGIIEHMSWGIWLYPAVYSLFSYLNEKNCINHWKVKVYHFGMLVMTSDLLFTSLSKMHDVTKIQLSMTSGLLMTSQSPAKRKFIKYVVTSDWWARNVAVLTLLTKLYYLLYCSSMIHLKIQFKWNKSSFNKCKEPASCSRGLVRGIKALMFESNIKTGLNIRNRLNLRIGL